MRRAQPQGVDAARNLPETQQRHDALVSYLMRVVLPDRPGMLGALATALGQAGGDILALDVVERGGGGAVDDLVVDLPSGGLADRLITAAQSVDGVRVESIRPHHGVTDLHRDHELVDEFARDPAQALAALVARCPGVFRASWAALFDASAGVHARSSGAPDLDDVPTPWLPLSAPCTFTDTDEWLPPRWRDLGTHLAAAPVGRNDGAILVARTGGPGFRAAELIRLAHLAGLAATVAALGTEAGSS